MYKRQDLIDPTANMDIRFIKRKYGKRLCIKGNINCTTTLVNGNLEDVSQEVKDCIKYAGYNCLLYTSRCV